MPPKYKPGGKKFPPKASSKPLPKQVPNNSNDCASSETEAPRVLDEEAENRFELELCWCVQQLEISLQTGKLGDKQSQESTKTLNLLKSNTVPLIRKRQVMRNTFGDYRAKMIGDEKKHGKYVSNVKFSPLNINNNKSLFLKKAATNAGEQNTSNYDSNNETKQCEENSDKKPFVMSKNPSNEPFKFNFSIPQSK